MTRTVPAVALAVCVAVGVAAADDPKALTFAKADLGKVPTGWKAAQTGKGASVWKVVEDKTAPSKSGLALAQTSDDRDALFNLCVAEETSFKDVEVSVAFKAGAGKKDRGGGVVWRFVDQDNYYVARMNPLEFRRILRDDGLLLVAVPAPDDLIEVRRAGRDRVARTIETFAQGFRLVTRRRATTAARTS